MIATPYDHDLIAADEWNDELAEDWEADDDHDLDFDDDDLIWDDDGLAEAARGDSEEKNIILAQLMEMTLSSVGGYQEVLEFSNDPHLESFAEVMIRQRMALHQALVDRQTQRWDDAPRQSKEMLSAIRSAWRLAIWNLEQDQPAEFADHAERAESLLEDVFLAAAAAFDDREWHDFLQDGAVMICGARSVLEELEDGIRHEPREVDGEIYELALA